MKNQISVKLLSFLFITLCFLLTENKAFSQTNLAKGKSTKQSSTAYGGASSRAVDGNTNGVYGNGSVTHTDDRNDRNQWWEVDLGQSYNIGSIKIHNRTDCCAERLKDIYILVSESPIQSNNWQDQPLNAYYGYNETYKSGPIVHTKNAKGRYIRIFRQAGEALSLAEVEVFEGKATPEFSGWYRLKTQFRGDGECLEGNQRTSKVHGGAAFMDKCQNVSGQLWKIEDAGNGYYRLKTQFRGEGESLEGNNGKSPAFMDKQQNVSGQLWKIEDAGNGWYRLKTMFRGEGECLEGNQASSEYMGGAAFMDKCQNVSGQLWKFVKEEPTRGTGTNTKVETGDRVDTRTPIKRPVERPKSPPSTTNASQNISAFVWYDQPTKPSFAPSKSYQYNSVGGAITGTRLGQGHYKLTFPNMAKHYDGAFHTTAYSGNHSAQVERWAASGSNLDVYVRVFDANGAPTDGRFSAMYQKETSPNSNSAYLWASAEGTPKHKYQYNGKGGISMKKTGTGVYQVTFEGMQSDKSIEGNGGNVIATPYGSTPRRIEVASWGNNTINIRTYDFNGQPADTKFVVSYNSTWNNQAAYVWGNEATKTTAYNASKMYQMNNASTTENTITRMGVGVYKITLPGIKNSNSSNAIAVAYGGQKAYASVQRWGANPGVQGTDVYVNTYSADGKPVDSRFSLFYSTNDAVK